MSYIKSLLLSGILSVIMVSCGGDSKEKVFEDSVNSFEEMATIYAGITDKASAEAAKPKLDALVKKMKDLSKRAEALGLDKKNMGKEMEADPKRQERIKAAQKKMQDAMNKLMAIPEVAQILLESIKSLNE